MAILVCGGAGYIGSHMVRLLMEKGIPVVVADNLVKGHKEAIDGVTLYVGDIRDKNFLDTVFEENEIESVIDFAAYSLVGESVISPLDYFNNNVYGTICLLEVMVKHNVKNFVFSSTAATYGEVLNMPITEDVTPAPKNPYGESKLIVERILKWCNEAYGLKYTALRYFNVAGAHPSGVIGEDHTPETHLIPIIANTALGKRDKVMIFGNDYKTNDGTCIRDYIHVMDLADAHLLALNRLEKGGDSAIYNLGNCSGFSVKEVIDTFEKVTGVLVNKEITGRRAGDPAVLIASSEKAIRELNWHPKFDSLEKIIETAWQWHKTHPNGYKF